jgi:glutamate-1-semialdehyde 2,1-aminomutase
MDRLAPEGPVYQAGTLSGNPLAMAAGIATLELLDEPLVYDRLEALGARLERGMQSVIAAGDRPLCFQRVGSMFCLYFREGPVRNYEEAKESDARAFGRYFHEMLRRGIYLAPSQFEAGFLSLAHTEADIDATLQAGRAALGLSGEN